MPEINMPYHQTRFRITCNAAPHIHCPYCDYSINVKGLEVRAIREGMSAVCPKCEERFDGNTPVEGGSRGVLTVERVITKRPKFHPMPKPIKKSRRK